jgi:hypothetical protein
MGFIKVSTFESMLPSPRCEMREMDEGIQRFPAGEFQ